MKEYIERADIKALLERYGATDDAMALIDTIPAADVAEVKHGRWIKHKYFDKCSECYTMVILRYNYCPNCGARMDIKEENNLGSVL